jgi:hypothetical protein
MWPIVILLGLYLGYRFLKGHPFENGAIPVFHSDLGVIAVPHDTPVLPPGSMGVAVVTSSGPVTIPHDTPALPIAEAANAGLLSPSATLSLAQALAGPTSVHAPRLLSQSSGGMGSADSATMGDWAMFDPRRGVGPDVRLDQYGIPRQSSLGRPFHAR